jgi:hypothetical protein
MDEYQGPTVQVADGVYEVVAPDEPGFCPDCGHIHRVADGLHPLPDQPCGSYLCCIN